MSNRGYYNYSNQHHEGGGYKRPRFTHNNDAQSAMEKSNYYNDQNGEEQTDQAMVFIERMGVKQQIQIAEDMVNRNQDFGKAKQKVCIFWLQGNCKKEDKCNFLHEKIEEKLPICKFFKETGQCNKGDQCIYRHILPSQIGGNNQISDNNMFNQKQGFGENAEFPGDEFCPYYDRGFCHRGDSCKFSYRHGVQVMAQNLNHQQLCLNYISGFCPFGPKCKSKHLKLVIIDEQTSLKQIANFPDQENWIQYQAGVTNRNASGKASMHKAPIFCHNCGKKGHKSTYCIEEKIDKDELAKIQGQMQLGGNERVLCFNCEQYGHYANMCPLKRQKVPTPQQNDANFYGAHTNQNLPATNTDNVSPLQDTLLGKRERAKTGLSHQIEQITQKEDIHKKETRLVRTSKIQLKDLKNYSFSHIDIKDAMAEIAKEITSQIA